MEKIISNDFRKSKELKLPESGLTVSIYSSILVGDVTSVYSESSTSMENNMSLLASIIKSWNMYESQEAESPLPINRENLNKLPIQDLEYLVKEMTEFATSQKKSTQN